MGRRRRHNQGDAPVTREEFEALERKVRLALQKGTMGMGVQGVLGGGGGGDDGYEWYFDGRSSAATDSDTLGGFTPDEIPYLSDGSSPGSSPTPTVQGGLAFLNVKWTAVANADRVTYEVHIGDPADGSGFTADSSTLVGETPGLQYFAHKDAAGAALVYGTDYYVKIIAKDADGPAAASAASAAEQLDPAGQDDILAGAITAEKLESLLVIANTLVAGTPGAQRIEVGYGMDADGNLDGFLGLRAFDGDGNITFSIDAASGEVLLRGDVYFGAASRLYKNQDIVELGEQTASAFEEPYLIQSSSGSRGQSGTASATWPVATQPDSYLLLVLTMTDPDGTPPGPIVPSGWHTSPESELYDDDFGNRSIRIWYADGVRSGLESITLGDTVKWSLCLFEFGGCDTAQVPDAAAHSSATSIPTLPTEDLTVGTGATAAPGQNQGMYFGALYAALDASGLGGNGDDPQEGFSNQVGGFTYIRSWAEHTPTTPSAKVGAYYKPITDGSTAELTADREYGTGVDGFGASVALSNAGLVIFLKARAAGVSTPEADKVRLFAKDIGSRSTVRVKDDQGDEATVVLGADDEVWRMELVSKTIDIPSQGAHSGSIITPSIPGLLVGDYCFWIGTTSGTGGAKYQCDPLCHTAGEINFRYFNSDSVTIDPPSATHYFLVIHRS